MTPSINTQTVSGYRKLCFHSIDDCQTEIQRIVAADEKGTLRAIGNWTPGQVMAHVAAWIDYAYDGYPIGAPPFFVRWILRFQLKTMLKNGMPRGVRIPGIKDGTTGMDQLTTREAADRLTAAFQRLSDREPARFDSPAFGAMSDDDRIRLNLRHAELHLGFLLY